MIKDAIKGAVARAGYRLKRKVVGDDYLEELVRQVAAVSRPVIFDVGAHRGETASIFSQAFPTAKLYCFEPFNESFDVLKARAAAYPDAQLINAGLSDATGVQLFNVNAGSPTNSLLELDSRARQTWNHEGLKTKGKVECQFYALDDFIDKSHIERIDLLKLDVQGAEYRVLEGARKALAAGRIRAIYLEIIVGATYVGQWGLGRYLSYLEEKGFRAAGLFNFAYGNRRELIQLDALCLYIGEAT